MHISMGHCKKDVTPLLTHWSYVFLAITHRYVSAPLLFQVVIVACSKPSHCLNRYRFIVNSTPRFNETFEFLGEEKHSRLSSDKIPPFFHGINGLSTWMRATFWWDCILGRVYVRYIAACNWPLASVVDHCWLDTKQLLDLCLFIHFVTIYGTQW